MQGKYLTIDVKVGKVGASERLVFELLLTSGVKQKESGIGLKKLLPLSRCFGRENDDILGRD